jgi:hypothetical protein
MTIHTVRQAVSYQDLLESLVKRTIILKRDVHSFPVLMTISVCNAPRPTKSSTPKEPWGTNIKHV